MNKKDNCQGYDVGMKSDNRRGRHNQENSEEQHKGEGSGSSIREERWINMRRRRSSIHRRKSIRAK